MIKYKKNGTGNNITKEIDPQLTPTSVAFVIIPQRLTLEVLHSALSVVISMFSI